MHNKRLHRERVLMALNHQEPDRVPMDLAANVNTSVNVAAYVRLQEYLGIAGKATIANKTMQCVVADERILQEFDIDTRGVYLGSADYSCDAQLTPTRWRDHWGIIREKLPGAFYYDLVESPLSGQITIHDILAYPWPDPHDPGRTRGLRERVEHLRQTTDCAILLNLGAAPITTAQYLRGFEKWFIDMAADPPLASALLDAILDVALGYVAEALTSVGDLVDIVSASDDLGFQDSTIVSPGMFQKILKPRLQRLFDLIHSKTPAKLLFHSCGSIYPFINDLIEMGVEVLNPIQVSAKGMEPVRLKGEFGDRLSFWGGIDTSHVLPNGTVADVEKEVAQRISELGAGGGYVLCAVHNLQPEVPPENIVAMYRAGGDHRY